MRDLVKKVEQWAQDRNIIKGATPQAQYLKLMEEMCEMVCARIDGNEQEFKDGAGDALVVLIILCAQLGHDFFDISDNYVNPEPYADRLSVTYVEHRMFLNASNMASAICRGKDAYQSIYMTYRYVRCVIEFLSSDPEECLELAYNEIKDRKGRMVDGVFVKEEDL